MVLRIDMLLLSCAALFAIGFCLNVASACPDQCECFNDEETVDCSRKAIRRIPELRATTRRLYMEDNRVDQLPRNAFRLAQNLTLLVLERNELIAVNSDSFCGLSSLLELNLGGNRIRSLTTVSGEPNECQVRNLKELNLGLNILTTVPQNLSRFAPCLEILNLSYNDIRSATLDASYSMMTCLRHLNLEGNRIHEILADDFTAVKDIALEILNLANCNVVAVDNRSFEGLGCLASLSLSSNQIGVDNVGSMLQNIPLENNMASLDISDNNLPVLTVAMLGSFSRLLIFNAARCNVSRVETGLFDRLSHLETLRMESGQLIYLSNLSALKKLRRLSLQSNRLTRVDVAGMYDLEFVDVSRNRLEIVPSFWISDLHNLKVLNLSHNMIRTIQPEAFARSSIVSVLDLSYNRLRVLRRYGPLSVARLDFSHNALVSVAEDAFQHIQTSLLDADLSSNNLTDWERLRQRLEKLKVLETLDLSGNRLGITLANAGGFASGGFPELRRLDLSDNEISRLELAPFLWLPRLTSLRLRNNRLGSLPALSSSYATPLRKLDLSGNRFGWVSEESIPLLSLLDELDISDNPFRCDCRLLTFLNWLNETLTDGSVRIAKLSEPGRYSCAEPGVDRVRTGILSFRPDRQNCTEVGHTEVEERPVNDSQRTHHIRAQWRHLLEAIVSGGVAFFLVVATGVGLFVVGIIKYPDLYEVVKRLGHWGKVRYSKVTDFERDAGPTEQMT